jgi:23S rRNA G2069 N7-methylase RlmK/C1962 C5-methylase RlmI
VPKARAAAQDQAAFSDRIRKQWNYREKNCKDKACLTSWYAYESDIMTKIAKTGDVNAK